jgi:hypothetical protein
MPFPALPRFQPTVPLTERFLLVTGLLRGPSVGVYCIPLKPRFIRRPSVLEEVQQVYAWSSVSVLQSSHAVCARVSKGFPP